MCGILGLHLFGGKNVDGKRIMKAAEALRHRGPDDKGFVSFSHDGSASLSKELEETPACTILAHLRLSIIDLSALGAQPMRSSCGNFWIVFNGEIYNYRELRAQLEQLGRSFRGQSDTEVLVEAFAEWGLAGINKLIGMFAFAVTDLRKKKMTLVRDYFGIKPLYYHLTSSLFAFASEIKGVLPLADGLNVANNKRIFAYLSSGQGEGGADSFFKEIKQLPPAHCLEIDLTSGEARMQQYWSLSARESTQYSYVDYSLAVKEAFLKSVDLHLRSDVPVGACVSGGIDSSAIVAAAKLLLGEDSVLHTFSYVADDSSLSEEKWIRLLHAKVSSRQHIVRVPSGDVSAELDRLILLMDEPFVSTSVLAQHRVFSEVKNQGIKVVLDGQGADEIFGGYIPTVGLRIASLLRSGNYLQGILLLFRSLMIHPLFLVASRPAEAFIPAPVLARIRHGLGVPEAPPWLHFTPCGRSLVEDVSPRTSLAEDRVYQIRSSLQGLLRYEDRNSMHFSVESRVPFLNSELVSLVHSLPEQAFVSDSATTKAVFRSAMRGIVPAIILDRRDKIGFASPEGALLRQNAAWVEDVLSGSSYKANPFISLQHLRAAWNAFNNGRGAYTSGLWRSLNLLRWLNFLNVHCE